MLHSTNSSQETTSNVAPVFNYDLNQPLFLKEDIPERYYKLTLEEVYHRTMAAKEKLGDSLYILAHFYQRDETFQFHDTSGDSLKLAKDASQNSAKYIVFCGVHFMAESADILTTDDQAVILPNLSAGCSLADTADEDSVEECWEILEEYCGANRFIPVTYINSSASLKAFCGKHGGIVCTSSNAQKVLQWIFDQGKSAFFFPDQHLGRNTANAMGVPRDQIALWQREKMEGGLQAEEMKNAKVMLWNGLCSVHGRFSASQIHTARKRNPEVKVVVHPECDESVVAESDYTGSTSYIIQKIRESAPGTAWAVGTEVNLVNRLHKEFFPTEGKKIESLNGNVCLCSTMYRTHPANVLWVLDNLLEGKVVNQIQVPKETAKLAKLALDRMLELS